MFKKPFRIKTNTQLKGSDTKKLKLRLLNLFSNLTEEGISNFMPNKETVYSVKIIVHSGEVVHLYTVQKLPVIFEIWDVLYPTVYMLWNFPELLPVFTTHTEVFSAISSGADLMLPGVVLPEVNVKAYGKLNKGDHVSVNLTSNKAPIAVGKAALSSFDMYMAARRGKCVNILHFYGDYLTNYGSTLHIPELGPVIFGEKCGNENADTEILPVIVSELTLSEVDDSNFNNMTIPKAADCDVTMCVSSDNVNSNQSDINNDNCTEGEQESTENVNELLMYCFLKSLKTTVRKCTFPLLASTFYKQHIIAACPPGKNIDIKKTKYKKFSNFLNEVSDLGVIKLEMVSKGVQSITSISFDNVLLHDFEERYFAFEQLACNVSTLPQQPSDSPISPEIKEKRTVTAVVLPLFSIYLNKKGDSLTMESIRKCITDYVRVENLKDNENKKNVKLDKLLKDIVGGNKELVTWDVLINSIVAKMGHSYELSTTEKKATTVKGKLQPIDIQVCNRVYNKKITLVNNLELFGIDVQEFAQECQHGVGASSTINNLPNSKSAQVQIQGNQVIFVNKLLTEKYAIQKRYIRGLEFAPKKKK